MEKTENISFEEAIKKLELIAADLEKNELDLDESVQKFEEGMKLSKQCNEMLNQAEKRITILINDGKDNFTEEDFKVEQ